MMGGSTPLARTSLARTPQESSQTKGSTCKGSARRRSTSHPSYFGAEESPIICGATVGSTRKGSTPFARTSPTPTPRGSSKIRGTLTSACKSSTCKGSTRRRSTPHPSNFGATVRSMCKGSTRKGSAPYGSSKI